jgi:hypothetical protein
MDLDEGEGAMQCVLYAPRGQYTNIIIIFVPSKVACCASHRKVIVTQP